MGGGFSYQTIIIERVPIFLSCVWTKKYSSTCLKCNTFCWLLMREILYWNSFFCGVAVNLAIDLHYLFDNDIKQTGSSSNGLHVLQKCNVIPKQKWIGRNLSIVCSCENAMPRLSSISRRKNGKHLKCSQNLTEKEARFSVGSRSKELWALAQMNYVGYIILHCTAS